MNQMQICSSLHSNLCLILCNLTNKGQWHFKAHLLVQQNAFPALNQLNLKIPFQLCQSFSGWLSAVISMLLIFLYSECIAEETVPLSLFKSSEIFTPKAIQRQKGKPLSKEAIVLYLNIESSIVLLAASLRSWHFSGLKGLWCVCVCRVLFSIHLFGESWWQMLSLNLKGFEWISERS